MLGTVWWHVESDFRNMSRGQVLFFQQTQYNNKSCVSLREIEAKGANL